MKKCGDHQVEISALLDGEGDPSKVLDVMEHVASCRACGEFVRKVRSVQAAIDGAYPVGDSRQEDVLPLRSPRRFSFRRPWAWGLAAALVVSLGLPIAFNALTSERDAISPGRQQVAIRLGEDSGAMTEERFVALVAEILRADPLYRNEMYAVLNAVREDLEPAETRWVSEKEFSRETAGLRPAETASTTTLN